MAKEKVYVWIGDDGDNKSVLIHRRVYTKGAEIPADKVDSGILATWLELGLVSEDGKRIVVAEAAGLEAEIQGLKKENATLSAALEKASKGKKADAVKELEKNAIAQSERIKEVESIGLERAQKIDELEADVKEKAARIAELEAEVEALTEPKSDDNGGGAGPGAQ